MKSVKIMVAFAILAIQAPAHANRTQIDTLPNGHYQLVAVRCGQDSQMRYAKPVQFKQIDQPMIEAKVPERDSLKYYYFSFDMAKSDKSLVWHWTQIHTGNATDDDRNHAPFTVTFTTSGQIDKNNLQNIHLIPETTKIGYLETTFNHQKFTDEDITGRMAKSKHLGAYTSYIKWYKLVDPKFPEQVLYEMSEDNGFGAPRHLLCGAVDAKMSYIVKLLTSAPDPRAMI